MHVYFYLMWNEYIHNEFFYLDIMANVTHADLWQQLVFIIYLFKIETDPLLKVICIQHNAISKTRKTTHRDM